MLKILQFIYPRFKRTWNHGFKKFRRNTKSMWTSWRSNNLRFKLKVKYAFHCNIKSNQPHAKLDYWCLGPFPIIKWMNLIVFRLQLLDSMKIHLVFYFIYFVNLTRIHSFLEDHNPHLLWKSMVIKNMKLKKFLILNL
jgi:hypothetical protein